MVIIVLWLVIGGIFAAIGSKMATERNRDPVTWAVVSLVTGIIGIIVLATLGKDESPRLAPGQAVTPNRWDTLVELDVEIAAAAATAREAGPEYERQLAEKYLALNDKQYLAAALASVLERARQNATVPPPPVVKIETAPPTPITTGKIGTSMYRQNADGTYTIIQGRYVGRMFSTFQEMDAALA